MGSMRMLANTCTPAVFFYQKWISSRLMVSGTQWKDYDKFRDMAASGKPFGSNIYMNLTSSSAVYGANEGEFDPDQARFKRERNHKTKSLTD
ncbi:hypothetical protein Tco_0810214 [Tanacetum coccineum]